MTEAMKQVAPGTICACCKSGLTGAVAAALAGVIAQSAKCATLHQQRQRLHSKYAALTREHQFPEVSVEPIGSEGQFLARAPNEHTFERHVGPLECQERRATISTTPCSVFNDNAAADAGIARATQTLIEGGGDNNGLAQRLEDILTEFQTRYDAIPTQTPKLVRNKEGVVIKKVYPKQPPTMTMEHRLPNARNLCPASKINNGVVQTAKDPVFQAHMQALC